MSNPSFSSGRAIEFQSGRAPSEQRLMDPYNADLAFNRVLEDKRNDPAQIIYSVDTAAMLRVIEKDEMPQLNKLTLACRPTRSGIAMWDVLFNDTRSGSMTSCIMMARADYKPIPQNRVVVTSPFLNFSLSTSRLHLNEVTKGDRIGIAINDVSKKIIYVLLYVIDGLCSVETPGKEGGRPTILSAVNVSMEHAFQIDKDDNVLLVDVGGAVLDTEKAMPFVTWLTNSADDLNSAYSWKPHFLPQVLRSVHRDKMEERIVKHQEVQIPTTFEAFEKICREAYLKAKPPKKEAIRETPEVRRRPGAARATTGATEVQRAAKEPPKLPTVEVVTLADRYLVKLDHKSNPYGEVYSFPKESLGIQALTETFLTNQDLVGRDVRETGKAVVLTADTFGEDAYLRFLTLNF